MSHETDYRRSAVDRVLGLRTRADLEMIAAPVGDQAAFIVRCPATGEAFHFSAQEHALLEALREPVTLRDLERLIETRFPPERATAAELQRFVAQLHEMGLVVSRHPGQGSELRERGEARRRRERWSSLLSLLSIRVASFPAAPAVDWLYKRLSWLFSWPAMAFFSKFLIVAPIALLAAAPELASRFPAASQLVRPAMLPVWLLTIGFVKICHELGHALMARRYGVAPQEAGLLLLAGAPALYCDVSDAWKLPSKRQRMAVSGAGMFVELVIAAIAATVWHNSPPGMVSTICLSLIVVCTVGTLLVNANPLLRYDGYYLLADWLEIPNLAERARGLWGGLWKSWLLGEKPPRDPFVARGKRRALWLYAIVSKAYLLLVLAGAFVLFVKLAKPHGLENLVYSAAVVTLAGMAIQPATGAVRIVANPAARSRFRWMRGLATLAGLAVLAAGILVIPVTRRVTAPLVVVPAESQQLFATVGGELEFALPAGSEVKRGDVVVRLANPELELALVEQQGKVRELSTRVEQLRSLRAVLPTAANMLPTAEAELADARAQLAERQAMVDRLVIHAEAAGTLLAPPEHAAEPPLPGALDRWHGSPLDPRAAGAWIDPRTPLAVVASPGGWLAWAGVDEEDAPVVAAGQPVRAMVELAPVDQLTGRVRQVSERARTSEPTGTRRDPRRDQVLGKQAYHVVEIELDPSAVKLMASSRGEAKIDIEESSVGEILGLKVRRALERIF